MTKQKTFKFNCSQSLFRWTIARKISGLASVLILFILVIIIYSITALKKIRVELREIAELDVPLAEISNSIEIHQLEQHLALDELLNSNQSSRERFNQQTIPLEHTIQEHLIKLKHQINQAIELSNREINLEHQAKFAEINTSLLALQRENNELNEIVLEIVQVINSNNYPDSLTIEQLIAKNKQFDRHALALIQNIEDFTARSLAMTEQHEQTFFVINTSLGIAASFLGILFSLIIIINIKTNIFQLSQKMFEVRQAISENKSIQPNLAMINASDEIGALAQELSKTIENFSSERDRQDRLSQELKKLATIDRLTSAFNRLKWEEMLTSEIERTKRSQQDLSVIIFDIDYFKQVNDNYGHDVGDLVLIEVVKIAQEQIRKTDSLYRIGGEEFTILAPYTNCDRGVILAERVRKGIENHLFEQVKQVTISMGVAQLKIGEEPQTLVKRADLALYKSKSNGRNQVNT